MGVKRRSVSWNARVRKAKAAAHPADTAGTPTESREQFRFRASERKLEASHRVADGATKGVAGEFIIPATRAKNNFGRILESVLQGRRVVITKHDMPKAVLISMDDFNNLSGPMEHVLVTLRGEFDALFAGMQTPGTRRAMKSAFHASPKELGKAAVIAARKRG